MKSSRSIGIGASAIVMSAACVTATAAGYAPRVGQPHVDFTLPKISDRSPVSLSQFRGKKVLLIQFASW